VTNLLGKGKQESHDFLYWEFNGGIRQRAWRAVRPPKGAAWELYDLKTDPSESKDVATMQPAILKKLQALAESAHEPAKPGQFTNTADHERDHRSKYGKHDDPSYYATPSGIFKKKTEPNPDK
jgi:hypothetical protein